MSIFSDNLRKQRERAGLTRQQMADVLHITANGYGLYETGRSEPKLDALVEIASTLRVSTDELLGYDTEKVPDPHHNAYIDALSKIDEMARAGFDIGYEAGSEDFFMGRTNIEIAAPIAMPPLGGNFQAGIYKQFFTIGNKDLIQLVSDAERISIEQQKGAILSSTYFNLTRMIYDYHPVLCSIKPKNHNEKSAKADDSDQGAKKG